MIKQIIIIFSLLISFCLGLGAQIIEFSLPAEAGKEYAFLLNKGIVQDTIQKGRLSSTGDISISIPDKYKGYIGMGSMDIKGNPSLNVIVDRNDFSVNKSQEGKLIFHNSPENDYLYSIMQDKVFPTPDTTLYAYHFIELVKYMQQLNRVQQSFNLQEKANVRAYALERLDMDRLYTSSIWYNVIDGLIRLNPDQKAMADDMVRLLKRTVSQEVFEHLSENLVTITEQFGWDDAFDIIVPYIQESGRIEVPRGNMFTAFALAKVRKGMPAPEVEGLSPSIKESQANQTLLVFYQPDCENCHKELENLIKIYPQLNQMGVRVVSISSDHQKEPFEKDKKWFPWPDSDKLCDFQGFAGTNFINYGIMATPTFFLIDKNQKVIKRYALISDIEFSSNIH